MGAVEIDENGNKIKIPSQEITNGFKSSTQITRAYQYKKYRGEANLWLSGNTAVGYASSTLTETAGSARLMCAQVTRLSTPIAYVWQTASTCQPRINSWDWVTTPWIWQWTGCNVIDTFQATLAAYNNTHHDFQNADGTFRSGDATAEAWYRCVVP